MKIERVTQKTVVEQVMARLKTLIASGHYKVHDRLPTEKELADRFGVGRTSIREAMKIFSHLGILRSKAGSGTFVCERANISREALTWAVLLGSNDLYELIHLRRVIEYDGLSRLVEKVSTGSEEIRADLAALELEIENMKEAVLSLNFELLTQADYNFHGSIIRASHNSLFSEIYGTLRAFMYEQIRISMHPNLSDIPREHQELLDSIRTGDPAAAKKVYDEHIETVIRMIRERNRSA